MVSYKKLGKNSLMVFLGNFGSKVIIFLMLPFYTRFLTPTNYGELDIINTVITLLTPLVTLAMSEAIFRLPNKQSEDIQGEYFTTGLISSLTGMGLFSIIYFLFFFLVDNPLKQYSILMYIILILGFIVGYFQQFTRSLDRMDIYVVTGVIYTFFFAGLNIFLVKKYNINGYLISMLFTNLIIIVYLFIQIDFRKYFSLKKFTKERLKEMLNYTLPLIPTATVWWIMNLSDRLILNYYHGGDAVGLYAVANKFPTLIGTIFGIFFVSWQMSAIEECQNTGFERLYNNLFKTIVGILNISNMGVMIAIYPIMKILVSETYIEAWRYVPILSLGLLYSNLSSFIGVNYVAFKKTRGALYTASFGALVNIILNFILIPKYSVLGASIATLIAYIALFIFRKIQTDKIIVLDYNYREIALEILINLFIYVVIIWKLNVAIKTILIMLIVAVYFISNRENILKVNKILYNKILKKKNY